MVPPTRPVDAARAGLAQLVEHLICNQGVTGSTPVAGTIINQMVTGNFGVAKSGQSLLVHPLCTRAELFHTRFVCMCVLRGLTAAFVISRWKSPYKKLRCLEDTGVITKVVAGARFHLYRTSTPR